MSLDGKVAWIAGGGDTIGRAVALALSARGVGVLVTGPVERALGVVVGEVAHGGGKARHLVGGPCDTPAGAAAVARALDVFGRLDIVVACPPDARDAVLDPRAHADAVLTASLMGAFCTFDAARAALPDGGRMVVVGPLPSAPGAPGHAAASASRAGIAGLVAATGRDLASRGITCNALLPSGDAGGAAPVDAEDVAQLVVFLCGNSGAPLSGQALDVTGALRARARAPRH